MRTRTPSMSRRNRTPLPTRLAVVLSLLLLVSIAALAQKKDKGSPLADPSRWQGSLEETLTALSETLEGFDDDDSRNLARAGILRLRSGDAEGAASLFERAEASDREDDEAFAMIGSAYGEAEMWSEADAWFQKAIDHDRKDGYHPALWGVTFWNRGDKDRAIELFVEGIELEGKSERLHFRIGEGIR